jgi:hypothetical protein
VGRRGAHEDRTGVTADSIGDRLLDPGDGPIDPSPKSITYIYIYMLYITDIHHLNQPAAPQAGPD